jgi:hypothetical protein
MMSKQQFVRDLLKLNKSKRKKLNNTVFTKVYNN